LDKIKNLKLNFINNSQTNIVRKYMSQPVAVKLDF